MATALDKMIELARWLKDRHEPSRREDMQAIADELRRFNIDDERVKHFLLQAWNRPLNDDEIRRVIGYLREYRDHIKAYEKDLAKSRKAESKASAAKWNVDWEEVKMYLAFLENKSRRTRVKGARMLEAIGKKIGVSDPDDKFYEYLNYIKAGNMPVQFMVLHIYRAMDRVSPAPIPRLRPVPPESSTMWEQPFGPKRAEDSSGAAESEPPPEVSGEPERGKRRLFPEEEQFPERGEPPPEVSGEPASEEEGERRARSRLSKNPLDYARFVRWGSRDIKDNVANWWANRKVEKIKIRTFGKKRVEELKAEEARLKEISEKVKLPSREIANKLLISIEKKVQEALDEGATYMEKEIKANNVFSAIIGPIDERRRQLEKEELLLIKKMRRGVTWGEEDQEKLYNISQELGNIVFVLENVVNLIKNLMASMEGQKA